MVARSKSPHKAAQSMRKKEWSLEEIREAYREALGFYEETLFLRGRERRSFEEIFPDHGIDNGDTGRKASKSKRSGGLNGEQEDLL